MITKDDLNLAQEQKYTDFKEVINKELMIKLNNNSEIQNYKEKINNYNNLKSKFKEINSNGEKE